LKARIYARPFTRADYQAMERWLKVNPGKKPPRTDVSTAARNLKGFKGITGSIEFDSA